MGRRRKGSALGLWMNGERVGTWRVTAGGEHELHYDPSWLESAHGRPVSLSMPLRPPGAPYKGAVVRNYFENLLPENRQVRERIARRFGAPTDAFGLLQQIGRDCVGAIQLMPDDAEPQAVFSIRSHPMSARDVEKHLDAITQGTGRGTTQDDEFRFSLAGAQEKTALLRHERRWRQPLGSTPTTHILKLPMGQAPGGLDLSTSVENEWLCMRLLRAFGIPTAGATMNKFGKYRVLCVERFDRKLSEDGKWLMRLPMEDFAQVHGIAPEQKYESDGGPGIRSIMDHLGGSAARDEDRRDFFRTQLLYWMLAAIDAHAKNFSIFIGPRGSYRLAPRYDVLSAYPVIGKAAGQLSPHKVSMAMAVWRGNRHYRWAEIKRKHFIATGMDCGLPDAGEIIDEVVGRTGQAISEATRGMATEFPASVKRPIIDGLEAAARSLGGK